MSKIAYADSIKVGYCGECDGLHIQLHNENGEVVAVAVLSQEQAEEVGRECAAFVVEGAAVRAMTMAKRNGNLQ